MPRPFRYATRKCFSPDTRLSGEVKGQRFCFIKFYFFVFHISVRLWCSCSPGNG